MARTIREGRVWHILAMMTAHSWNPFIHRLEGKFAVEETLRVEIEPSEGRVITKADRSRRRADRKIRWIGG